MRGKRLDVLPERDFATSCAFFGGVFLHKLIKFCLTNPLLVDSSGAALEISLV